MGGASGMARRDADVLRAFRLATEIHRPHWHGLVLAMGLLTAIFIVVVVAAVLPNRGPAVRAYGQVLTVNVTANDAGPKIVARVRTADGERTLFLPRGWTCWPGDRIELLKRGKRYSPGIAGCVRP